MAKGDGSIRQARDKNGKPIKDKWEVCAYTGFNPVTKSYGRTYKTVRGTKVTARKALAEMRRSIECGIKPDADKVKFGAFATEYLDRREKTDGLATATIKDYRYTLGVLNEYLADAPITSITPQTIDSLYMAIQQDRGIKNTTLRRIHVLLNQVMKQAVRYDLILRNPLDRVDAPKCEPVERKSLTSEEGTRLLECLIAEEQRAYNEYNAKETRQEEHGNASGRTYIRDIRPIACVLAARFGLATGARRGEILALEWGSILPSGVAVIRKNITQDGIVGKTKTKASNRRIAFDGDMLAALLKWRKHQETALGKIGITVTGETPVFCDSKGSYINPVNFSHWWEQFRNAHGFEGWTFHELRHTQATQLLANGVDLKTVQTRLGHSNASVTLNFYAHALPENDHEAADLIGTLFGGNEPLKHSKKAAKTA